MNTKQLNVIKRDGSSEPLNVEKIHKMVFEACRGLENVSASLIEMSSHIQFYEKIKTSDIQEILIKSAADLISEKNHEYQYAASRLLLFSLRKEVLGKSHTSSLIDLARRNVDAGVYDNTILESYSIEEFQELEKYIDHERDLNFSYAGLRQIIDKYLVQDRSSGKKFETPQFMYMMIAMTVFSTYPADQRMSYVKKFYDAVSLFYISLPTPVMAGVRTPLRQYSSCVLIDIDDSLDSIFASDMAIGRYVAKRAGIGLNCGRIRGIGSAIRRGEVVHTGVIPFLKKFEATVRCCTQNGVRGGSSTVHFPVWHQEIEDIIVLKNNKGTEDNRVRKLDYSIQLSKLFYQRYLDNSFITLFSPHDVPGLYDAFGTDKFDELYRKYEKDFSIPSKKVSARDLFHLILKERAETGRIYLMNIDHVNSHSSFNDHICMSNLCQEITLPTTPIENIEGEGDIALCVLSAINIAKIEQPDDFKEYCSLAVRALDQLIDYQEYPVPAARQSALDRRSLGIGFIGLAHFFAKNSVGYGSDKALQLLHRYTEAFQYYLIDASAELAREKGACRSYSATKYSRGIFPVDTYKEAVDELGEFRLQYDWDLLRRKVSQTGLRNSALSAQMPSESSSVVSNETNGIEPPRGYMSVKKSKKGTLKQIVPEIDSLKDSYSLLWDMKGNEGYIKTVAVMQKFFDQGISGNWSYNPLNYDEKQVPVSKIAMDMLYSYKLGWKTVYYQNTYDYKNDFEAVEEEQQCAVCVI